MSGSQNSSETQGITSSEDAGSIANGLQRLVQFLRVIRLRKGVMVGVFLLVCVLGGLYYVTKTRIYQSSAELLVLQVGGPLTETSLDGNNSTKDMLPTYLKILKSDEVLNAALEEIPEQLRTDFVGLSRSQWAERLRTRLAVSSTRRTNVLELSYRSVDPKVAPVVLNSVLTAYIQFLKETYQGETRDILQILSKDKADVEQRLAQREADHLRLMRESGDFLRTPNNSLNPRFERVLQLNNELVKALEETIRARAMLQTIQNAIANNEDVLQHALTSVDAVGKHIIESSLGLSSSENYTLGRLNEQLLNDKSRLQSMLEQLGPNHPDVRQLNEAIRQKEQFITNQPMLNSIRIQQMTRQQLAPRLLSMAQQRLRHAVEHEQTVRQHFTMEKQAAINLNGELAKLENLQLDIDRLRDEHAILINQIKDFDLGKTIAVRTKIVSHPNTPTGPVSPRLSIVMLLTIIFGSFFGVAAVFVLDSLDDRFRSPEELRVQLQTTVLAMVPKMPRLDTEGIHSVQTFMHPNGPETEAFRTLRTALEFSEHETRRIVMTSTEPGDGKTTVVVNMAVAFAQSGRRTLLIDADMRRPGLSTLLGLRDGIGLSRVLRSHDPIPDAVMQNLRPSGVEGLDVIACGTRPTNPSELLASERFVDLIAWAETQYDQVLVDAPPILAVSDPAIAGRMLDGVVVVVRPDKDRRKMVIRACENLRSLRCRILGVVVNHLSAESGRDYSYGYGYGYGYNYGSDDLEIPQAEVSAAPANKLPESFPLDQYQDFTAFDEPDAEQDYRRSA